MTYEKLRYLEQLLSNIYKEGLIDEQRQKIEIYFEENYGEDALVKPESVEDKEKKEVVKQVERSLIPNNLQEMITKAVKRTFGE